MAGYLFAYQRDESSYGCILVKQDDPVERRRFSAAHELGHYLPHFLPLLARQQQETRLAVLFLGAEAVYSNDASPDEPPPVGRSHRDWGVGEPHNAGAGGSNGG